MSYNILTTKAFEKQFKRLYKKYPSLKQDMLLISQKLKENPNIGLNLGYNCFKLRITVKSKNKGKSSGARLIYYIHISETNIYLISIYDKSEIESISKSEITNILNSLDI